MLDAVLELGPNMPVIIRPWNVCRAIKRNESGVARIPSSFGEPYHENAVPQRNRVLSSVVPSTLVNRQLMAMTGDHWAV